MLPSDVGMGVALDVGVTAAVTVADGVNVGVIVGVGVGLGDQVLQQGEATAKNGRVAATLDDGGGGSDATCSGCTHPASDASAKRLYWGP